jgi:hypothetical protein
MRTLGLMCGVFSLISLGCGEPFFAGSPGEGGASASTSSGMGGDGGESSGGGGGEGGCACKLREYCTGRGTCAKCTDLGGVLAFGTPPSPVPVEGTAPSFPRARSEEGDAGANERLVYVARFGAVSTDIGEVLGRPWGTATRLDSAQINTGGAESGPLLLPGNVPSPIQDFTSGSLLFDSVADATDNRRKLFVAETLQATERRPIDGLNEGVESYSVAVAHASQPYRYWFMNTRVRGSGTTLPALVTKRASDTEAVPLRIQLPGGCVAGGDDLAPWVTPDGAYLFFQAPYSARGRCDEATVVRSFFVKLEPNGLPSEGQIATLLLPTFAPSTPVMTPSLSADMCTLFFASVTDGQQLLYTAPRK